MSRTVGGGWHWIGRWHRTVELEVGERVLYEADAAWNAGWLGSTMGKVYVTNQRLVWARDRFQILGRPRPPILAVSMASILGTEVKHRSFGNRWRLLVRTRERSYSFVLLPVSLEEDIDELRDMIEKALGSRETPA